MGAIKTIKRLAADILKVGVNRIRIKNNLDEAERKQLEEAMTRANVRDLVKDKIVSAKEKKGRRRGKEKRKKTRGTRRGKKYSIVSEKERWMERVRAQRKYLKALLKDNKIEKENKRMIYLKIKGGLFRSKQTMYAYLKDNKMIKE